MWHFKLRLNKKSNRLIKGFFVTFLVLSWLLTGWPATYVPGFGIFPPKVREVQAVSLPATSYVSSASSAVITGGGADQIVTTAPAAASTATSCKNAKTTGYCQETPGVANVTNAQAAPTAPNGKGWIFDTAMNSTIPTGTWTFNMRTTSSSATGTGFITVCAWKVKVTAGAISSSTAIFACTDGATNVQGSTSQLTFSVAIASVPATSFAATEYLYVEFWLHSTVAGTSTTGKVTFESNAGAPDDIVTQGASSNLAPSAPSQDSPLNNATGVSTTPTFLMTATDPELNGLGYKVTIYSNNLCTTVVQTNDQAISSTGWTGTNATCTGAPTSCYASGTQGSFLTQTALSASTQYWWKASAKDPDGLNTFTDSSTCNNFTTAAANPTYTQNHYRWYVDAASENVTDPWSATAGIDIAEDTAIPPLPFAYDPPGPTETLRLRTNITVNTATITGNSKYFKLQYRTGIDSDCSTGTWTDVGTGDWLYNTSSSVVNGTALTIAKLTATNILETYSKAKPATTPNGTSSLGQNIEFDFNIVGTNSTSATRYLFRVVETDNAGTSSTNLAAWTNCPILTTKPGTDNFMRHGEFFSGSSEQGFFWAN